MSLSILVRSVAVRRQAIRARSLHTTAPVRSDHGHYHHLPFQFPGERKALFGFKLFLYMASGFSIPFLAARYQLTKGTA